jgi:hypothetical protein
MKKHRNRKAGNAFDHYSQNKQQQRNKGLNEEIEKVAVCRVKLHTMLPK